MDPCSLCNLAISKNDSFTRLDCAHTFHASCLHLRIAHMYAHCPICVKGAPVNGIFQDLKPLNFGDDWKVNDHGRKFWVLNTIQSHNIGKSAYFDQPSIPLFLNGNEMEYYVDQSSRIPMYPTKSIAVEKKSSSLFEKFAELQWRESRYGYSIESDPLILIGNRTSSVDMRSEKHIDMRSIVKSGIKMDYMLNHGYCLIDLKILDANIHQMVQMGFNSSIWKKFKHNLPYIDTIRYFNLRFGDIFTLVCQGDIERFAWLDFSIEEMIESCTNVGGLVMGGLSKKNIELFSMDMDGWAKMGMSFHMLKNQLCMTRNDVRDILKWVRDLEIDVAFQKHFETLFKHKFLELEKGLEDVYTTVPFYN